MQINKRRIINIGLINRATAFLLAFLLFFGTLQPIPITAAESDDIYVQVSLLAGWRSFGNVPIRNFLISAIFKINHTDGIAECINAQAFQSDFNRGVQGAQVANFRIVDVDNSQPGIVNVSASSNFFFDIGWGSDYRVIGALKTFVITVDANIPELEDDAITMTYDIKWDNILASDNFAPLVVPPQLFYEIIDTDLDMTARGVLDIEDESLVFSYDGDPVHMVTGNFTWNHTDLSLHGATPLEFTRHYNSADNRDGELGRGWRHNFMYFIEQEDTHFIVHLANGNKIQFDILSDDFIMPRGHTDKTLQITETGFRLTDREQNVYAFNEAGHLTSITDVGGNSTTILRNDAEINTITNRSGTFTFTYENGKIVRIEDHAERYITYSYDSSGNLSDFTNADGNTISHRYNASNRITHITDFNEAPFLENRYDDDGRVTWQEMNDQGTFTINYDTANRVTTITDQDDVWRKYHYNQFGQITVVSDVIGSTENVFRDGRVVRIYDNSNNFTEFDYDVNGNRTAIRYFEKDSETPYATETFAYNANNLVTRHTRRDGSIMEFGYDARGNTTTITTIVGGVRETSSFTYDSNNNLTSMSLPGQQATTFTHDERGNVLTQTDPLNNITRFEYDSVGRLIKQYNPVNAESTEESNGYIQFLYSPAGKLIETIDARGASTTFEYDGNGFIVKEYLPMNVTTITERDGQNRPVVVTDGRGNVTRFVYDAAGNITEIIAERDGSDELYEVESLSDTTVERENTADIVNSFEYDERGRIITMTDGRNNSRHFTHNAENRVTSETDPYENETKFDYDLFGNLTSITSPLGNVHRNEFDSMGRLIATIDPEDNRTEYVYDAAGRLTGIKNPDQTFVTFEYNAAGWLTATTDENRTRTTFSHNENGQVLTQTNVFTDEELSPIVTAFTYDDMGRIRTETDAMNGVTTFGYDENSNLVLLKDALGGETEFFYDLLDRVNRIKDPRGFNTWFTHDANGNITQIKDALDGETDFRYDEFNRLIYVKDPEGHITRYAHDENGNIISQTDARNNTTHFYYDKLDRLVGIREHGSTDTQRIVHEYDKDGRLTAVIDQRGETPISTNYKHDRNGRVTEITDALNNKTEIEYDVRGRVSLMRQFNGERPVVTRFAYTPTGLLRTVTEEIQGSTPSVTSFEYDELGRLTAEINANREKTVFTNDALGRVTSVTDNLGHTTTFTYDALSRITSVTDKNGITTYYEYDRNGNLTLTKHEDGDTTSFYYDALNRLIRVVGDSEETTIYQYDKRGLVTRIINHEEAESIYVYDPNGNLISQTDENGNVTTFTYDPRNLVSQINYTGGRTVNFAYNAVGQLTEMQDWTGTTTFEVDLLGRVTEINDANNRTVSYRYNSIGNQTHITYGGITVERIFDDLGRMTQVRTPEGVFSYTHDGIGRVLSLTYPNEITETLTRDGMGQVTAITQTAPESAPEVISKYTYDPMGNLLSDTSRNIVGTPFTVTNNEFNQLNQMIKSTISDINGNILNSFNYEFDKRGNLIRETDTANGTERTFIFDTSNRLVSGKNHQGEESRYTFNGLGGLVSRETRASSTHAFEKTDYLIDYMSFVPTVLMEFETGTNGITKRHVYDDNLKRISTTLSTNTTPVQRSTLFIHNDRLGSAKLATNSEGVRVANTSLDEWGNILEKTVPTFAGRDVDVLNTFTNHIFDDVLGVYFAQARFYDPTQRRFISPDQHWGANNRIYGSDLSNQLLPDNHAIVQAGNLYAYAMNNPLRFTDPTGESILGMMLMGGIIASTFSAVNNALHQAQSGQPFNWSSFGTEVFFGVTSGMVGAVAFGGLSAGMSALGAQMGLSSTILAGSFSAVPSGIVMRTGQAINEMAYFAQFDKMDGQPINPLAQIFDPQAIIEDAVLGAAFAGVGYGVNKAVSSGLKRNPITNAGKAFNPSGSSFQVGVDPNTLQITRELLPEKTEAIIREVRREGGIFRPVRVQRSGRIIDGNHRVAYARKIGAAVDVDVQ